MADQSAPLDKSGELPTSAVNESLPPLPDDADGRLVKSFKQLLLWLSR